MSLIASNSDAVIPYWRAIVAGYSPAFTMCVPSALMALTGSTTGSGAGAVTVELPLVVPATGIINFSPTRIRSEVLLLAALRALTEVLYFTAILDKLSPPFTV